MLVPLGSFVFSTAASILTKLILLVRSLFFIINTYSVLGIPLPLSSLEFLNLVKFHSRNFGMHFEHSLLFYCSDLPLEHSILFYCSDLPLEHSILFYCSDLPLVSSLNSQTIARASTDEDSDQLTRLFAIILAVLGVLVIVLVLVLVHIVRM